MQQIDTLLARLEDRDQVDLLRRDIFALLQQSLEARREQLDDWEKLHFSNAIGTLALNANAVSRQPLSAWLRLCLADLRLALFPVSKRHDNWGAPIHHGTDHTLDYVHLSAMLNEIAAKIDPLPPAVSAEKTAQAAQT